MKSAWDDLAGELYNCIDRGLYKRDAYKIADLIDQLITERLKSAGLLQIRAPEALEDMRDER